MPLFREYLEQLGGVKENTRKQYVMAIIRVLHWYENHHKGPQPFIANRMPMVFLAHFSPLVSIVPYLLNGGTAVSTKANEIKAYIQLCRFVTNLEVA